MAEVRRGSICRDCKATLVLITVGETFNFRDWIIYHEDPAQSVPCGQCNGPMIPVRYERFATPLKEPRND